MKREHCSRRWLSHNIGRLVGGRDMLEVDLSIFKGLTDGVVLDFDMVCLFVKFGVLTSVKGEKKKVFATDI